MAKRIYEVNALQRDEAWRAIRRLRSRPPVVLDDERTSLFSSALEQAEQQFRAAEVVGHESKPLNLYYGVAQAGRALSAAATPVGENPGVRGHGLRVLELDVFNRPDSLMSLRVRKQGEISTSYGRIAHSLGSDPLEDPISLGQVYNLLMEVPLDSPQPGYPHPAFLSDTGTDSFGFPVTDEEAVDDAAAIKMRFPQLADATLTEHVRGHTVPSSEGPQVPIRVFELPNYRAKVSSYRGAAVLMPACPGGGVLDPLLAWWVMLYALSMMARYSPVVWTKVIDVDRSELAVPLETLLDKALDAVPDQIRIALERL